MDYLRELDDETAAKAREYICRAPAEVRTPYRQVIEAELGWVPVEAQSEPEAATRARHEVAGA